MTESPSLTEIFMKGIFSGSLNPEDIHTFPEIITAFPSGYGTMTPENIFIFLYQKGLITGFPKFIQPKIDDYNNGTPGNPFTQIQFFLTDEGKMLMKGFALAEEGVFMTPPIDQDYPADKCDPHPEQQKDQGYKLDKNGMLDGYSNSEC